MASSPIAVPLSRRLAAARWVHRVALGPAVRFFFPAACFVCGEELGRWQHLGACLSCWAALGPLRPPLCTGCGLPVSAVSDLLGPARGRCGRCLVTPPALDLVRACVPYDDRARAFLLRIKIGARSELLRSLALRMAATLRADGFHDGCTVLAPVPSNPWNDLRRGFSPSGELARQLSRETGIRLCSRLLIRFPARDQTTKKLGRRDRAGFVRRVYRAAARVPGENVLLVDDVMTTGCSAEVCARLVKRAGAAEVRFAAWARTLPGRIPEGKRKFA